jgi:hypothetical protein
MQEIAANLFLFSGSFDGLRLLPKPLVWTFPYNCEYALRLPARGGVIYDCNDDLSAFPNPGSLLGRKHRRAMREADLVVARTRKLTETVRAIRADALYLPNAVEASPMRPSRTRLMEIWNSGRRLPQGGRLPGTLRR